jgi:hypothetical protein
MRLRLKLLLMNGLGFEAYYVPFGRVWLVLWIVMKR